MLETPLPYDVVVTGQLPAAASWSGSSPEAQQFSCARAARRTEAALEDVKTDPASQASPRLPALRVSPPGAASRSKCTLLRSRFRYFFLFVIVSDRYGSAVHIRATMP